MISVLKRQLLMMPIVKRREIAIEREVTVMFQHSRVKLDGAGDCSVTKEAIGCHNMMHLLNLIYDIALMKGLAMFCDLKLEPHAC